MVSVQQGFRALGIATRAVDESHATCRNQRREQSCLLRIRGVPRSSEGKARAPAIQGHGGGGHFSEGADG